MAKAKDRAVYFEETTPSFLVSYPHVFVADIDKTYDPDGKNPKFKMTCLWDTDDKEFKAYEKKIKTAAAKLAMKIFDCESVAELDEDEIRWNPFLQASRKQLLKWGEAFENRTYIRVSGKKKPQIIDGRKIRIIDNDDPEDNGFYPGCFARLAHTGLYAYDVNGNQGISVGLCNIQKTGEGEPLGGGKSAEQQFESIESDDSEDSEDSLFD